MKSTGLYDKWGKEIFEGDILCCGIKNVSKQIVTLKNDMFILKTPDGKNGDDLYDVMHRYGTLYEIIDNIYDRKLSDG